MEGGIENCGIISGNFGINASNGILNGGILNEGTIEGTAGVAVYLVDTTLSGGITIQGTDTAEFIGDVLAEDADVTIDADAVFTNGNAWNVKSFIIEEDVTFNLNPGTRASAILSQDGITVSNGVHNSGTLSISETDTATITGDYTQAAGGVFEIGANSATTYGKLVVTGTANLGASAQLAVNLSPNDTLAIGTVLPGVVRATGTLTGNFTNAMDNSSSYDFRAVINGNAIDLVILAPRGPAEPVPTLSQWAMIILVLLLAGSALLFLRRRKRVI